MKSEQSPASQTCNKPGVRRYRRDTRTTPRTRRKEVFCYTPPNRLVRLVHALHSRCDCSRMRGWARRARACARRLGLGAGGSVLAFRRHGTGRLVSPAPLLLELVSNECARHARWAGCVEPCRWWQRHLWLWILLHLDAMTYLIEERRFCGMLSVQNCTHSNTHSTSPNYLQYGTRCRCCCARLASVRHSISCAVGRSAVHASRRCPAPPVPPTGLMLIGTLGVSDSRAIRP